MQGSPARLTGGSSSSCDNSAVPGSSRAERRQRTTTPGDHGVCVSGGKWKSIGKYVTQRLPYYRFNLSGFALLYKYQISLDFVQTFNSFNTLLLKSVYSKIYPFSTHVLKFNEILDKKFSNSQHT